MNEYVASITMQVVVTAPALDDAEEIINDYFGTGPEGEDINVTSFECTID